MEKRDEEGEGKNGVDLLGDGDGDGDGREERIVHPAFEVISKEKEDETKELEKFFDGKVKEEEKLDGVDQVRKEEEERERRERENSF